MIRVESVSREFGAGPTRTQALNDVSFDVGRGEFVAVAGPSGSGKTTLLNLIGGLDRPTHGRVRIDRHDLELLGERELADLRLSQIGFVFQEFNLIPVLTARENVELPLLFRRDLNASRRRARVNSSLSRVGLADKRAHRPSELSGGEQQRVAIARAVAGTPGLVLADEPTANLDRRTGGAVIELMHELNSEQGMTFLYATHDPELIGLAGRVIGLLDGRRLEETP